MNKEVKFPVIDSSRPTLEQITTVYCEWQDSDGFKYTAHNYDVETGKCIKCGKSLGS